MLVRPFYGALVDYGPLDRFLRRDIPFSLDHGGRVLRMSTPKPVRNSRLWLLFAVCLLGAVAALGWWVLNLQVAISYFATLDARGTVSENQTLIYRFCTADFTTASPLMMLLSFLFPMYAIFRLGREGVLPEWLPEGFPRHWTVFVIYVGLAATLFGMVVALAAVGTEDISSAERQQEQLIQLIAGTSTALVSSLVALLAAFTSLVLKFALKKCANLKPPESSGLKGTLAHLTERVTDLTQRFDRLGQGVNSLEVQSRSLATTLNETATRIGEQASVIENVVSDLEEAKADLMAMPEQVHELLGSLGAIRETLIATEAHQRTQKHAFAELLQVIKHWLPQVQGMMERSSESDRQQLEKLGELAALKTLSLQALDASERHAKERSTLLKAIHGEIVAQGASANAPLLEQLERLVAIGQAQGETMHQLSCDGSDAKTSLQRILDVSESAGDTMRKENQARLLAARALLGQIDNSQETADHEGDGRHRPPLQPLAEES